MKVFEKVVHRQVTDFSDENHLLSNSQSGIRNCHSTDTAVTCVSDYILSELSEGKHVCAVLIDLKKAFDTVDHQILLKILFCYGFRDMSFGWFQSYLSNLMQCTLFNEVTSDLTREHPFGVPQDSVLGPLLFLIYINDVEQTIDSDPTFLILYADDKILIQSSKAVSYTHLTLPTILLV